MNKNKKLYDPHNREMPAPIPLLINPADVKKEFDKHRCATPEPFQDADDTSSQGIAKAKLPESRNGPPNPRKPKAKNSRKQTLKEKLAKKKALKQHAAKAKLPELRNGLPNPSKPKAKNNRKQKFKERLAKKNALKQHAVKTKLPEIRNGPPNPSKPKAKKSRKQKLKDRLAKEEALKQHAAKLNLPESQNGSSKSSNPKATKNKKQKAKEKFAKKKNLKRHGSSESLITASSDKSSKKSDKKTKKPKLDSLERKSFGTDGLKFEPPTKRGSIEEGREMFAWIIDPVSMEDFFSATWERRPLHISREMSKYYSALLSTTKIDRMLRENALVYGKNLDVTSYVNNERKTLNPEGRAWPAEVWDFYNKGCSIRLLNPQTFNSRIWTLNAMLQEYFGCFVGANVYLTPPGTQGFAPHYDDIEAFILQLEGKKHWKLYSPRSESEQLPRFSSQNFTPDEIGPPIMDIVLHAGDLLYFPRGTIHQAKAMEDTHSLHITISCYQKNTWGDFIEKAVPAAIEIAINEDMELRRGLPRDYLQYLGAAHCEKKAHEPRRLEFEAKLRKMVEKILSKLPVDAAADQFGKRFIHDALPPKLDTDEIACCSMENSSRMVGGQIKRVAQLNVHTQVRLVRANILRIVAEEEEGENDEDDEKVRVYHYTDNSREYHADDPRSFYIDPEEAEAIETLIHTYPSYLCVGDLPLDSDKEKVDLANKLWKKGILLTSNPLETKDKD